MTVFPNYTPPVQPNCSIVPVDTSVQHAVSRPTAQPEQPNVSLTPTSVTPEAGKLTSATTVQKQINATLKIVNTDLVNAA